MRRLHRSKPRSSTAVGVLVVLTLAAGMVLAYQKDALQLFLRSGDVVQAEFPRDYKLRPGDTDVKIAGSVVGKVTDVDKSHHGRALVTMKLNEGNTDHLGSAPSAAIRPKTLLGGNYYVELKPSGDGQTYDGGIIPAQRTSIPVELDQVLAAVPGRAQQGIRTTARALDKTLEHGGRRAVRDFLRDAPKAMRPAGTVLSAARGTRPGRDLTNLVTNVQSLASALTGRDDQLGEIVSSLSEVSSTLSESKRPLADTVSSLPETLGSTKQGMRSLRGTLDRLSRTADDARPMVRELDSLLRRTDPVLREARPLLRDLVPALRDVRPTVETLVPATDKASKTLDNISGPVMDRVKGPIVNTVMSPWHGKGFYEGNGNDNFFYQELGYLAARAANLSYYGDKNGMYLGLGFGGGISSVGGVDLSAPQLLEMLGVVPQGTTPAGKAGK